MNIYIYIFNLSQLLCCKKGNPFLESEAGLEKNYHSFLEEMKRR